MSWWGHRKHRAPMAPEPTLDEVLGKLRNRLVATVLSCDVELGRLCVMRDDAIGTLQFILPDGFDAEDMVVEKKQALDRLDMELEVLADIAQLPGDPS